MDNITLAIIFFLSMVNYAYFIGKLVTWHAFTIIGKEMPRKEINRALFAIFWAIIYWTVIFFNLINR